MKTIKVIIPLCCLILFSCVVSTPLVLLTDNSEERSMTLEDDIIIAEVSESSNPETDFILDKETDWTAKETAEKFTALLEKHGDKFDQLLLNLIKTDIPLHYNIGAMLITDNNINLENELQFLGSKLLIRGYILNDTGKYGPSFNNRFVDMFYTYYGDLNFFNIIYSEIIDSQERIDSIISDQILNDRLYLDYLILLTNKTLIAINEYITAGNSVMIKEYLEDNLDIEGVDKYGRTALHSAILADDYNTAELLLKKGADTTKQCPWGTFNYSPLMLALYDRDYRMCNILLKYGADINFITDFKITALQLEMEFMIYDYEAEPLLYLLKKGAASDFLIYDRYTPMGFVLKEAESDVLSWKESETLIKAFLESDTDSGALNSFGDALIHEAVDNNRFDIISLLIEFNADLNIQNRKGLTPFLLACKKGRFDIVKMLHENGADITVTDKEGQNALTIAEKRDREKIAAYLKKIEFQF